MVRRFHLVLKPPARAEQPVDRRVYAWVTVAAVALEEVGRQRLSV